MTQKTLDTLEKLYAAFDGLSMEGGWHRRAPALWPEQRKNFVPACWHYAEVRPILEAAGHLVDTEHAERRNLTMTNPVEGNIYPTVRTMVAAYQLVKPGEVAYAHRHTPSALRIILDGVGSYTTVDGTRVEMRPGDVLLTPSWCWHSHENSGNDDCYWIDVLDVPLVHLLEPMFFERHPDRLEREVNNVDTNELVFRWEDSLAAIETAEPCVSGMAEREIELGSPAMPTTAIHIQRFAKGVRTATQRTTANQIYAVLKGAGQTIVDGQVMHWTRGDVIAVPAWRDYQHEASEQAYLVRISDEPVFASLGLLRRQLAHNDASNV